MKKTYTFTNATNEEAMDSILETLNGEAGITNCTAGYNDKWAVAMCRDGMTYAIVQSSVTGQFVMVDDETERTHTLAFKRNDTELLEAIAWDMVGDTRLW